MTTLTWQNNAGSLGSYPAGDKLQIQLLVLSSDPSSVINYRLLSGNLPLGSKTNPMTISTTGLLSGTLATVYSQEVNTFTVRAMDQYGNVRDRTFSISVMAPARPKLTAPSGKLFSISDSTWVNYLIDYDNPSVDNIVNITCSSDTLPPGLYVQDGRIKGYANPPTLVTGSPINKTYTFTLHLESKLGNDSVQYSIEVLNQQLSKPPNSRKPSICNSKPRSIPTEADPYYGFYVGSDNKIRTVKANEEFSFKILGQDFDNDSLLYSFSSLPPGLTGNPNTGWITGKPIMYSTGINEYNFTVGVAKLQKGYINAPSERFFLKVINNLNEDIVWETDSDLGTLFNNTISTLSVKASSAQKLIYSYVGGNLPANLTIENSGAISGRVAYQPSDILLSKGMETEFEFVVQAFAEDFPALKSYKTFKLTIKQQDSDPTETVYLKAAPSLRGKQALKTLLNDVAIIPTEYLYRPDDGFFGKSESVKVVQAYGIKSTTLQKYIAALTTNHYHKNVTLGALKTAIARDDNGNALYEVVYSPIVDDLVNNSGVSVPKEIKLPKPIVISESNQTINNTTLSVNYSDFFTSSHTVSIDTVYPASLANMEAELVSNLDQTFDPSHLPRWMTTQQSDGNTIGFIKCWVICYTLPGYALTVKTNIETKWSYALTDIDCTFDRYYIDKSSTYNWNTNLSIPAWTELPSEVRSSNNPDQHDLVVLFPTKTILPK